MSALTAVAMSGGVDSSVAAALVAGAGRPAVGFSLHVVDTLAGVADGARYGRCCSAEDFRDARAVADRLGFPHYVLDVRDEFRRAVLAPFAADYATGRTPSPCVRCNTFVKFGVLGTRARAVGAERVATGHYARLARDPRSGRTLLLRARDASKDQSYYLFDLDESQRRSAEFPLGELDKGAVRGIARELGLATADKPESMDLCFVARGEDYRGFLTRAGLAHRAAPGVVVDRDGRELGRHEGIDRFTVGQRRGLGIASGRPLYVVALEAEPARVVVGERAELARERFTIERPRWIPFTRPRGPLRAEVRLRARHAGSACTVRDAADGTAAVALDEPQHGVTPGQAAVFYDGDHVLGGGWIAG